MVKDEWACENQASGTVVAVDPGIRTYHRKRRALKKATDRLRNRIHDLITKLHHKATLFLVSNKHKALQRGKVVIEVNEAYTSQTVSWTGEIKKMGSAKFISSGRGVNKVVVDRDYNGARGIMLRALRASSIQVI